SREPFSCRMPGHAIPVSGPANARTGKFSTIFRIGASDFCDRGRARGKVFQTKKKRGNECRASKLYRYRILESGKIDSLRALAHAVWLDVERYFLSVGERAQASILDSRDVNEHILLAVVRRDKAEALGGVEKFYGAGRGHGKLPV